VKRYTAVWAEDVQNDFIEQWIGADSERRTRLTEIADTIDRELSMRAESLGETLPSEPALRVWRLPGFDPAVSIVYERLADDRIARVLRISMAVA
jgi:hypothetical protein